MGEAARRKAIVKAVEAEGDWLPVYRHLIARATQLKRTSPMANKIMREDAKWMKKHFRKYDIAYDVVEGRPLPYTPEPHDWDFDGPCVVRMVPELNLVEVAVGIPEEIWTEIAAFAAENYRVVERPPERIIFRSHRGVKVNVFLDNAGG
jgi:hypothetical protein